jgi:phosphoenolpyruvate---glycerone phosphotransferase subunit DhaM
VTVRVGLVIVSHSAKLADGVCELAAQMAPDVVLAPAGGTDDGGIGTSFGKVQAAIASADTGSGAVVLADLGSAVMTAEAVLEFLDDGQRVRVLLADAPLVEGAVAAAVAAQTGAEPATVASAAEGALAGPVRVEVPARLESPGPPAAASQGSWEIINPMGLHARPAAHIAQAMADLDAEVQINGVDAKSVMLLMTLGLGQGKTLTMTATGPDAAKAVQLVEDEVRNGFGEL